MALIVIFKKLRKADQLFLEKLREAKADHGIVHELESSQRADYNADQH